MKIMATKFGYKRDAVRVKAMVRSVKNFSQFVVPSSTITNIVLFFRKWMETAFQIQENSVLILKLPPTKFSEAFYQKRLN